MSRLNQIIQSCRQRSATVPTATAPPADAIALNDSVEPAPDAPKDGGNPFEQLKPKIKEILEEIKKEEEKLCSDAHSINPREIYHKVPVLSRVGHNLPDPIRLRLKAVLCKLFPDPAAKQPKDKAENPVADQKRCGITIPFTPGAPGKQPDVPGGLVDGPAPVPAVIAPETVEAN